jgi:predicted secreted protein
MPLLHLAPCVGLVPAAVLVSLGLAHAGDAAARRVVGFSPDGRYFAFEQYTMVYEDDAAFSEYIVIDTVANRYVEGTPVRSLIRGDDGLDEKKARSDAAARAKPLLEKLRIAEAGVRIAGKPSIDIDDIGIYQLRPDPPAKSLAVSLPGNRPATLSIDTRPMAEVMCDGYGGRATPAKAMGYGLTLTMTSPGIAPTTLLRDEALPASRRCAADYGIAEAYLYSAPGGAITLAVLVEVIDNADYHAGPNRRFMAVTRRLK